MTTFIWDLDGTLIDSYEVFLEALSESFANFNLPFDRGVEFYSKLYKPKQILLQYQQLQEMKQKTGTIPPCHLQALKMEHG